jgi:hypothetical protein
LQGEFEEGDVIVVDWDGADYGFSSTKREPERVAAS